MNSQRVYPPLTIHLAVDGSEHSIAAAQFIRDLPLPQGSKVVALGVLSRRHTPSRYLLLAALDDAHQILQDSHAHVSSGLLHGNPDERLTDFANRHRPNLVVIGAKGLRATLGILLGGVAQQVVEYAHRPVLVVRAPYTGLKRVLLAVDGSQHSQHATQFLSRFPIPDELDVRVMNVLPPMPEPEKPMTTPRFEHFDPDVQPPTGYETERSIASQAEIEEQEGQALLAKTLATLRASGIQATGGLKRGDAATEIIEYAKSNQIDMVVVGSRGLTTVKSWLLGSVSRKLVHYAGCSVLIVKAPHKKSGVPTA